MPAHHVIHPPWRPGARRKMLPFRRSGRLSPRCGLAALSRALHYYTVRLVRSLAPAWARGDARGAGSALPPAPGAVLPAPPILALVAMRLSTFRRCTGVRFFRDVLLIPPGRPGGLLSVAQGPCSRSPRGLALGHPGAMLSVVQEACSRSPRGLALDRPGAWLSFT